MTKLAQLIMVPTPKQRTLLAFVGLALFSLYMLGVAYINDPQYPSVFWDDIQLPAFALAGVCIGCAANISRIQGKARLLFIAALSLIAYLVLLTIGFAIATLASGTN